MERIKQVAILTKDGQLFTLERPCRHCDIFCEMQAKGVRAPDATQGFVTEDGRFVDRSEAYQIAHAAGQILFRDDVTPTPGTLYSEDLW